MPTVAGVLRALKTPLLPLLDSAVGLVPVTQRESSVVVRLDAVGDLFIWLQSGAGDVARFARRDGRRVVLLANAAWADYARFLGLWDEVIPLEPVRFMKHPLYRLRMLLRIRRLGAQLLIQCRPAREFLLEDAIARGSGAALRIGSAGTWIKTGAASRRIGYRWWERLIPVPQERDVHELVRNDEFVRQLTGAPSGGVDLGSRHETRGGGGVAIALGAGQTGRIWPVEKLARVVEHLRRDRPERRIVLYGSPAERALGATLESLAGEPLENRVAGTTLIEFVAALAAADLVICNDSSAFHIATALRKKVVCCLGGGHFGWFAPYPADHPGAASARVLSVPMDCYWCNWYCPYPRGGGGAFRCVDAIPVAAVTGAIDSLGG